jgi:hypothetical protein
MTSADDGPPAEPAGPVSVTGAGPGPRRSPPGAVQGTVHTTINHRTRTTAVRCDALLRLTTVS